MSGTDSDEFDVDNGTYDTMNAYLSSLDNARELTERIQATAAPTAEDLGEGRRVFTSLHLTSEAHAEYMKEDCADIWDLLDEDHVSMIEYRNLLKISAQSQAAASAFANGTVPDLAFVLEEESQAAPAGEVLEEDPRPSVKAEADGDGAGGHG